MLPLRSAKIQTSTGIHSRDEECRDISILDDIAHWPISQNPDQNFLAIAMVKLEGADGGTHLHTISNGDFDIVFLIISTIFHTAWY